ncbi:MlaD family protein [Spiribacter halobius]|uniref:Mce/MlaD domain-containing protein n=1 Tax=Sediminicurvatus halobius TaxID=2182432 RepID=A0A2U2N0J8_9GAMM|nr:MlaD family protein [Spiribacter halobius]PWG62587.1 hypothetical protein DEM34_11600 [Spiribacter halobius]UEX78496.1 MlaD family protein [Spiribacter halobius]
MQARVSYSLVGLFVLLLGVAVPLAGIWLAGGLGTGSDSRYYVVYLTESASGLHRDAQVTYRGVEVGRIAEISIARERRNEIRLLLAVDPDAPVREGTTATLQSRGLTGGAYLELSGGEPEASPLRPEPGARYPEIPYQRSLLGQLDTLVREGMSSLDTIAARLDTVLSPENAAALNRLLTSFAALAEGLERDRAALREALAAAEEAFGSGAVAAARVPETLDSVEATLTGLERMAERIGQAGDSLSNLGDQGSRDLARLGDRTLPIAEDLLQTLERTAERLRRLAARLEDDPSQLLYGPAPRPPGPGEERAR